MAVEIYFLHHLVYVALRNPRVCDLAATAVKSLLQGRFFLGVCLPPCAHRHVVIIDITAHAPPNADVKTKMVYTHSEILSFGLSILRFLTRQS